MASFWSVLHNWRASFVKEISAMKIGIIGSGNVGGTLGKGWARVGHHVMFGFRDPNSSDAKSLVQDAGPSASAGTIADAANHGDAILLATPWDATQQVLTGAGDISRKVLIDATNPLLPGLAGLAVGCTTSGGELVAQWAPSARVVKALNTVGFNVMANPTFPQGKVAMFYCGDDGGAKQTAASLIADLGFEALDAGPLSQSRLLEPFALLWISLALKYGYTREIAFQFMRRQNPT
jgi:predicted dinucleotide-binding enzyme